MGREWEAGWAMRKERADRYASRKMDTSSRYGKSGRISVRVGDIILFGFLRVWKWKLGQH